MPKPRGRYSRQTAAAAKEAGTTAPKKLMRDALLLSLHRAAGKGKPTKQLNLVADALVKAATKGDVGAAKEIFDRIDGKVVQGLAGADGEGPVTIIVRTGVDRGGS